MKEIQGWINLYKPKNISSFQAIHKIKKKFFIKKIGHGGTLDPLAEGILPIAIGKTTKLIPFISSNTKKYYFSIKWGTQTSTDDAGGEVINKSNYIPNINDIKQNLKDFIGYTNQIPPRVSAVKINGQRAYKLAREKKEFLIEPKKVFVSQIEVIEHKFNITSFSIESGKGYYIRSFARDLSVRLGTCGHILSLERVKVGKFTKETSILLDDLLKIGQRLERFNCIKPSISMLDDILAYEIVNQQDLNDLSNGKSIKIDEKKLNSFSSTKDRNCFFLSNNGEIISIGRLVGNLFKPNKILI